MQREKKWKKKKNCSKNVLPLSIYSELATLVLNEEEKKKEKFITMVWQWACNDGELVTSMSKQLWLWANNGDVNCNIKNVQKKKKKVVATMCKLIACNGGFFVHDLDGDDNKVCNMGIASRKQG